MLCLLLIVDFVLAHLSAAFTKSVGALSAEQNGGHAQSGRLGHEGEAVLRRHRDQGVGRGLLRPAEAVPGGPAQVSCGSNCSCSSAQSQWSRSEIFDSLQELH